MKQVNGYLAAPFTPMHPNGDLNLDLIPDYADLLMRNGLDGVFVCGSTGEGALLTREERMDVAERWVKACGVKMKIIVQTGATNLRDQQTLAAHAEKIGAWGVAAMAPAFLPPKRNEELLELCKSVAAAASTLPFYYYHIPILTGVKLSVVDLLESVSQEIPNFAGAKYTSPDTIEFKKCLELEGGKFDMLWGMDELFLDALALNSNSGVGGTYNLCFPLYDKMREAYGRNDHEKCKLLKDNSRLFFGILEKYRGPIIAGKCIMKMLGLDCGPNRLPLQTMTEMEERSIKRELDEKGFFNYCML